MSTMCSDYKAHRRISLKQYLRNDSRKYKSKGSKLVDSLTRATYNKRQPPIEHNSETVRLGKKQELEQESRPRAQDISHTSQARQALLSAFSNCRSNDANQA